MVTTSAAPALAAGGALAAVVGALVSWLGASDDVVVDSRLAGASAALAARPRSLVARSATAPPRRATAASESAATTRFRVGEGRSAASDTGSLVSVPAVARFTAGAVSGTELGPRCAASGVGTVTAFGSTGGDERAREKDGGRARL